MGLPVQPIFLFADSQLLFWCREDGSLFLKRLREDIESATPKAAYVGASNGDQPEFFDLFQGAMAGIGWEDCRMIPSEPTEEDLEYFDEADLVLLAGGDVRQGWRAFKKNGLKQKIIERYYAGAVLVGVSAGAVQLGLRGSWEDEKGVLRLFETFKLVPAIVDVHDEANGWERLGHCLQRADEKLQGLGIPSGGGAVLHQDLSVEPVRRSLVELTLGDEREISHSIVFPGEADEAAGEGEEDAVES
jgi:cyanophycinase